MASDQTVKKILIEQWDDVTKPLLATLNERHLDAKIGCVDKAYQAACEAKEAKKEGRR